MGQIKKNPMKPGPARPPESNPKSVWPNIPDLSLPKDKSVEVALSALHKKHGAESVVLLSDDAIVKVHPVFPSGSLALDFALGVGGWPFGRIIEAFGPEQSGKTTIALQAAASIQRMNGVVAYIDAEHAVDIGYASQLGVDVSKMMLSQPDSGEQALDIAESLVRSKAVNLIIVDSVAALVPKAELEGAMGDQHIGLQARLMSQALRKLAAVIHKAGNCSLFLINQLRMKIGVQFGSPETTTGGRALKFYASVRVDVRKIGLIKKGEDVIGQKVKIKVVKNKVAMPFKEFDGELIYGKGLWRAAEIVDIAVEHGIVEKSGSWLSYQGERLGLGRDNAAMALEQNQTLCMEIEKHVRSKVLKR